MTIGTFNAIPKPLASDAVIEARDRHKPIRQMIFLYFVLLIFEGALRKWILPGLATPLLVVRDPVLLLIYAMAFGSGVFPLNGFTITAFGLALANFLTAIIVNPLNIGITFFGLHADFLHLPLIYLMPAVLSIKDVRRYGFYLLLISIPMAVLVYYQFKSPPTAWINTGAGIGSAQIEVGVDKIRPPGTFSYSTGLTAFASLVTAYLLHQFFTVKPLAPKWIFYPAVLSAFVTVGLSCSRTNLVANIILIAGTLLIPFYQPKLVKSSMKILVSLSLVFMFAACYNAFREGMDMLNTRIINSGGVKTGLVERYVDSLFPFSTAAGAPLLGYGIGMGTNAAAGLLYHERSFLLAEDEWQRVILESGPIFGTAYIFLRIAMVIGIFKAAIRSLKQGNTLSMMLFLAGFIPLLNGQFGQPTALGFTVFTTGLCLAAAGDDPESEPVVPDENVPVTLHQGKIRGRSVYAERLHEENNR